MEGELKQHQSPGTRLSSVNLSPDIGFPSINVSKSPMNASAVQWWVTWLKELTNSCDLLCMHVSRMVDWAASSLGTSKGTLSVLCLFKILSLLPQWSDGFCLPKQLTAQGLGCYLQFQTFCSKILSVKAMPVSWWSPRCSSLPSLTDRILVFFGSSFSDSS